MRSGCLSALATYAARIFPAHIVEEHPSGKDLDARFLAVQKELRKGGLSSVRAEKTRMIAKAAITEQWARDRVRSHAQAIDGLRSEIDRG